MPPPHRVWDHGLTMARVPAAELTAVAAKALTAAGAPAAYAQRVAEGLVGANLCGVDTHGVSMLPFYVSSIRSGDIDPAAAPEVIPHAGGALVRGHWTFGHVAALEATRRAVAGAHREGICGVALVEAHHIGRLGEYAELAAADGVCLIVLGGGQGVETPVAVPYGGREAVLHTNPIAIGLPAEEGRPVVVDIATTAAAGAKVAQIRQRGEKLPQGFIVDRDGRPTTDPAALLAGGSHLPFGGHKGYALMLAAEVLGRIVPGADDVADTLRGGAGFRHSGFLFIALRSDLFVAAERYRSRTSELLSRIRASSPADGFSEVLVPGDPEARTREARRSEGIPLTDELWRTLVELAKGNGTPA